MVRALDGAQRDPHGVLDGRGGGSDRAGDDGSRRRAAAVVALLDGLTR